VSHPWDSLFRAVGFGTAADHHVHHALFTMNYGHLFTYADRAAGTYRAPNDVAKFSPSADWSFLFFGPAAAAVAMDTRE